MMARPNKRLQRPALRAAAEPERYTHRERSRVESYNVRCSESSSGCAAQLGILLMSAKEIGLVWRMGRSPVWWRSP